MAKKDEIKTIQEAVYEELKRGILMLILSPGQIMSTQEMATRLNVSRTPIREAFLRLQNEGLVDPLPQKGTAVSRINLDRVDQECFIRESMEMAALKPFLKNCTAKDIAFLRDNITEQKVLSQKKDCAGFVKCDNEFHKKLFEVAGVPLAWDIIANNSGHYNRIRILVVQEDAVIERSIRQHEELVESVVKCDLEHLRELLTLHIHANDYANDPVLKQHPEYFTCGEEEKTGIQIGTL